MKAMKQILFITLCLCLALCTMSMGVLADDTGSITIKDANLSSATVSGKTFNVYKVFNATYDGNYTSYSWYKDSGDNIPFYNFFFGADGVVEKNKTGASVQEAVAWLNDYQTDSYDLSQLAEKFYDYINENGIQPVESVIVDDGATSVTIDGLTFGYYVVYDATTLSGAAVRSSVMLTNVDPEAEIYLKANRPDLKKYVLENGNFYGKGTSCMVGEDVTFKIVSHVPSHTKYNNYHFAIKDILPQGFTLNRDSIKVYNYEETATGSDSDKNKVTFNEDDLLTENTDYTLSFDVDGTDDKKYDFVIDFTLGMNSTSDPLDANTKLVIVYSARATNGIAAQAPNVNTAYLEYSNDPTNENSRGETTDTANVYSYLLKLSKYQISADGTTMNNIRLDGAKFQLYKVNGDTVESTPISFTQKDVKNSNGDDYKMYVVAENASGNVNILEGHNSGEPNITITGNAFEGGYLSDIVIFGLKEGTYHLVEIEAPAGYVLPEHPFVITITDVIGDGGSIGTLDITYSHTGTGMIGNVEKSNDAVSVKVDIGNKAGQALPETGGMGTTLFTVIGLVLMCAAGVFFAMKRRSHAK